MRNANQHFTKFRFRPRLHMQFLLATAMRFFENLSCRQRAMKIASVATLELPTRQLKKSREIQLNRFLTIFFQRLFSAAASPVQEWLQLRFSSCASDMHHRHKQKTEISLLDLRIFVSVRTNSN